MGKSIFEDAVMCGLHFTGWSPTKRLPVEALNLPENVDASRIRARKELVVSEALEAIGRHDRTTRDWLEARSIKFPLAAGWRLLPLVVYVSTVDYLQGRQAEREPLVDAFCEAYPDLLEEARAALGDVFDALDYPDADEVRRRFSMTYTFAEFSAPGTVKKAHPELFQAQQKHLEEALASAVRDGENAMVMAFDAIVERFIEILTPGPEGKKKRLHETLLGNAHEFFEAFQGLKTVVDLPNLEAAVARLQGVLASDGVDTAALKTNEQLRARVLQEAAKAQVAIAPMVRETGRALRLDD